MKYYYQQKAADGSLRTANGPDPRVASPGAGNNPPANAVAPATMSPPLGPRALALLALLLNLLSHPSHQAMTTIDQLYVVVSRISAQCHDQSELITTLSTKLDVLVQQVDSLKILAHEALQLCMAVHSQTIGLPVERMVEHMSQQLLLLQRSVDDLRPERRPQQLATTTNNYANLLQHPPPPKAPGARGFGGGVYGDIDQDTTSYYDFDNVADGGRLGKKHRLEDSLNLRLPLTNNVLLAPGGYPAMPVIHHPTHFSHHTPAHPSHVATATTAPTLLGDIAYPFQIPNHIAAEVYPSTAAPRYPDPGLANLFAAPQLPRPQLQPQLQPQGQPQGQQAHLPLRGMPHRVNSHDGSAGDEKYDHQDIPKYRMERLLKLILEIWREYEYGLNDKPPLKQLELQYGTKWRNETELRTFLRRKKIYEAIEVGKQKGYTEDEIIADLEEHRSYNVNGLVKRYPLLWLVVNMPAKYTNDP